MVGVAWYDPSEWNSLRRVAPDAHKLETTHAEWLIVAERGINDLASAGLQPRRIPVKLAELLAWCDVHRRVPDASARAEFVSQELRRLHQAGLLTPDVS